MNELLNVQGMDEFPVSGRNLHERLEIGTAYKDWFPRMCEYGFEDGTDFCSKMSESTGGRPATDHTMTLSMAKELCMLQRTDKGREVRRYLISVEEAWNKPEMVMARALKMANSMVCTLKDTVLTLEVVNADLQEQVEQAKPKVLFAESVSVSDDAILIGELAKILKGNGIPIGQNRMFERLRQEGYLIKRRGTDYNTPTQKAMELGLFKIKETAITHADGHVTISKTAKVTGRGQQYFVNRFMNH